MDLQDHGWRAALLMSMLMLCVVLHSAQGRVSSNEVHCGGYRREDEATTFAPPSFRRSCSAVEPAGQRRLGGRCWYGETAVRAVALLLPGEECGCCGTIQVQRFNFSQRGCLNLSVDPSQLSMMMDVYLNNKSVYQQQISGRNPPPICVPVPQFPLLMLCARLYDIHLQGNNVHVCVNLEAQLQGVPLLVISFDCIRFGADGFVVEKPQLAGPFKATSEQASEEDPGPASSSPVTS